MLAVQSLALGYSAAPLAPRAAPVAASNVQMNIQVGDIGTTRPLGVWDPLGLISTRDMCVRAGIDSAKLQSSARPATDAAASSSTC